MEGLFYYSNDLEKVTFLWFYPDGRVIAGDYFTQFDQSFSAIQWFRAESHDVYYSRGIYQIGEGRRIRIVLKDRDYGTLVYRGTIQDENTIVLYCRCPFTHYRKSATYMRFSDEQYIMDKRLRDICAN